jgi:transposase
VDELDAVREEIVQALAQVKPATAWRRLRKAGRVTASLPSFYRYVHQCVPEVVAAPQVTVRRPDPPPGEEGQVDYGLLGLWLNPLTQRRQAVHVFALVLSHSRHQFATAVLRMDQQAWLACHVAAFTFFGGVPRRLVPDNLKAGVLRPDLYDPRFNRGYAELAQHYGFLIDPARAGKPTDKPRVERAVPFVREDAWRGRVFTSLTEINAALERWCLDEAGQRVHGTTRQRPLAVFRQVEQPALLPLPAEPFELATWTEAKVARDCHIQVGGAWYSVPFAYVGKTVAVRLTPRLVQGYLDYRLIKTHVRVPRGQRSTDWDDYPPDKAAFFRRTPDWCRAEARRLGPAVGQVVVALLQVHALHHLRQAQGLVRLGERYGAARLEAACARALAFGDPSYRTVKTILERGLEQQPAPVPVQQRLAGAFLRGPAELLAALLGTEGAR